MEVVATNQIRVEMFYKATTRCQYLKRTRIKHGSKWLLWAAYMANLLSRDSVVRASNSPTTGKNVLECRDEDI